MKGLLIVLFFLLGSNNNITYYWNDKLVDYHVEVTKRTITGGKTQVSLSGDQFKKFALFNPSIGRYELPNTTNNLIIEVDDFSGNVGKPVSGYLVITQFDNKIIEGSFEMVVEFKDPYYVVKITKGHFKSIITTLK